jgi:hypothetical protein
MAMISISRSVLLAAALAAFPLAGAVGQAIDTGKPSSASANDHAKNGETAMKSTAPGYMRTGEIHGITGKSPGNAAATGETGKKPAQ